MFDFDMCQNVTNECSAAQVSAPRSIHFFRVFLFAAVDGLGPVEPCMATDSDGRSTYGCCTGA
jgi:hypothetical protein